MPSAVPPRRRGHRGVDRNVGGSNRFLTDAELAAPAASSTAAAAAATLRDRVDALIAAARAVVGYAHPGL